MKETVITLILSFLFLTGFTQEKKEVKIDNEKCNPSMPNPKHFCGDMITKDPYVGEDKLYDFKYQKVMYESACIDIENMSEVEIGERLRKWWDLNKDRLICDSQAFGVTNGSVLKVAVRNNVRSFVDEAIYYKLDLNHIDNSDGETVLDYASERLKTVKGTPLEKEVSNYYKILREAGARHSRELK
ncbi:hypothetical protein ACR79P_14655 [Sphingobacterium spiritivorum]|uniref:hypothetical protein n=1 Tax=Sphingobacterium spiritivorum TaxID=258 RepID=UPI003DA592F6